MADELTPKQKENLKKAGEVGGKIFLTFWPRIKDAIIKKIGNRRHEKMIKWQKRFEETAEVVDGEFKLDTYDGDHRKLKKAVRRYNKWKDKYNKIKDKL